MLYIYIRSDVYESSDRFAGHIFVVDQQVVFSILQSLSINMTLEPKLPL